MSLDITLYTEVKPGGTVDNNNAFHAYNCRDCSQNVKEPGFYLYEKRQLLFGTSCRLFNKFRDHVLSRNVNGKKMEDIWKENNANIPFYALINCADNEGSFDTETCQKLAEDFSIYHKKAHPDYSGLYKDFKNAFEQAAKNNGYIQFS